MCLYEPINGDYPTAKFCNEYPLDCEGCPYSYNEETEVEKLKEENK